MKKSLAILLLIIAGITSLIFYTPIAKASLISDLESQLQYIGDSVKSLLTNLTSTASNIIEGFNTNLYLGLKNNSEVKKLQTLLAQKGYLNNQFITGNYFNKTADAVRQLQKNYGLPQTGFFGPLTRKSLNNEIVGQPTSLIKTVVPQKQTTTNNTQHQINPEPSYDISAIEKAIFNDINNERAKNGLQTLTWSDQLASIARVHSQDQANDNTIITDPKYPCNYPFIRHEGFTPAGFKVSDRVLNQGIDYQVVGENIIIFPMSKNLIYTSYSPAAACVDFPNEEAPTGETYDQALARVKLELQQRLDAIGQEKPVNWVNKDWKPVSDIASEATVDWMNSPGHRKNILTPEFTQTGIGIAFVNDYMIATQVFLLPR